MEEKLKEAAAILAAPEKPAQMALATLDDESLFKLVVGGDVSKLTPQQKLQYYKVRCDHAGLDPTTQPFEYLKLQGKELLYAKKAAGEQLAAKHGVVCSILDQRSENGIRVVTVRATAKDGRMTEEIGAVTVDGLRGDALCNAFMKAVTKAKRRAVLSLCGLGMLDESELETVPSEAQVTAQAHVSEVKPLPGPAKVEPLLTPAEPAPAAPDKNAVVAFGKNKGKELRELSDDDLTWWTKVCAENAAKTDSKFVEMDKARLAACENEWIRRKAKHEAPSWRRVWDSIKTISEKYGWPTADVVKMVKEVTGKGEATQLTDADIPKVEAYLIAENAKLDVKAEERKLDVPF